MHLYYKSCKVLTPYQHQRSVVGVAGGSGCKLTTIGPQHVNHSPWCAHNDFGSSLQLSNLNTTMGKWVHGFQDYKLHFGHFSKMMNPLAPLNAACSSVHCTHLLTDTSAAINTHHPQSQWFGELLALLGNLQSQLSGWSHDHSCNIRRYLDTVRQSFSQSFLLFYSTRSEVDYVR